MYNSGIALSAVAALFIPVDFYTFYVNSHISPEWAGEFRLLTSAICLAAYTVIALRVQSRIFGYLVSIAAGSVVLSGIETAALSRDWYAAGLTVLAAGLIWVASRISRSGPAGRWRVLAEPFRYVALLTVGVLMPATLAWRVIDRSTFDTLHYALTVTWWVGGFVLGWGAVYYRSRSLGHAAAIALPVAVYLAQAALFDWAEINPAWHALGWALLVNVYFVAGYRFSHHAAAVVQEHGRTANRWGTALLLVAAFWSLTDLSSGAATAASHALLVGAVVLAVFLWKRPRYFYAASLLSVTAVTFTMSELGLPLAQACVGWVSLALLHVMAALALGRRFPTGPNFAAPLVIAGYIIGALALLPPALPYDSGLLLYTLGNWTALAAWGAYLAHTGARGFVWRPVECFHWLAALPLPFWLWVLFDHRDAPVFALVLALAALAWGLVALSYHLRRLAAAYRWPWYVMGLAVSVAAPVVAWVSVPEGFGPALCLLSAGLLYFADALAARSYAEKIPAEHRGAWLARIPVHLTAAGWELVPAGLTTAWGVYLCCAWCWLPAEILYFALAAVIAGYFFAGLGVERRRSPVFTQAFWRPLYFTAQALTLLPLVGIYLQPFQGVWTDVMQMWGTAAQVLLGVAYLLYAWGAYREFWAHVGVWLGAAGAGFFFAAYSQGRGSSAFKLALLAMSVVLAERGLLRLRDSVRVRRRVRAYARLAWSLYQRPLLTAGWTISAAAVGLALLRNLWLLGGGRTRELWAVAGLWTIVGLYALAARLFRQARFVWLAAFLSIAPWTILTHLDWFWAQPPAALPRYAFAWTVLAWGLFLLGRLVQRLAPRAYAVPLRTAAHLLLPFALLWGVAHAPVSRYTYGMAVVLYALESWRDARRAGRGELRTALKASRFLYATLGLIPVWCVYLLMSWLPAARHEHYGLLLLAFGPLGLIAGQWLERVSPPGLARRKYALPAYLTGYISLIVGTMLVAHLTPLLALVLLGDALLLAVSAWLFRDALWVYPAAALVPISLLLALWDSAIPGDRQGWCLIGLAALYLALAWALRRAKLREYGSGVLAVAFALIALGLPPSSRDQTGALWGYGAATLLYAVSAGWLRQPLLLTPACALVLVPYAIELDRWFLPEYHGLLL
ncbi:MAG: hypothetical protein U9R05_04270, partial [Chloroflexota bacterium]|nr:hypothetical protein [Chloroflexota bacterium]